MIGPLVQKKIAEYPKNRLLKHLEKCAMFYHCFAAKNIFAGRWEAPLPTSPTCHARCIGCLSLQEGECPASQDRINKNWSQSMRGVDEFYNPVEQRNDDSLTEHIG